ncbi:Hypothetical predicted protein [Paramuricea clavata]|uniref:Uncharacterized protein n=1 Tax=Paramuricea clavata TaxID=317549 RepID=A0A7D9HF04_PARCT|nr:Hypothetical predicted protein [Paramuricea clavata]
MNIKGGKETSFQVDTGATCNVIKRKELSGTKYMNKMKKTKQVLKMYNSSTLKPVGQCMVQLQNPETCKKYKVEFTVIDGENCTIFLGSRAAQQVGLVNVNYHNMKILSESDQKGDSHTTMATSESSPTERSTHSTFHIDLSRIKLNWIDHGTDHYSEYKDIFEGLGQLGQKLHLELEENVKPVQQAVRKIPESMKDPLKSHLAELEDKDPRPPNKVLKRCHHPMQTIEDILPELGKAKAFSKLGLSQWLLASPFGSRIFPPHDVLNAFGRYKWKRLPFGISPAGEIFQSRLDQAIDDLEGVKTVADDILVIGNGESLAEAIIDHDAKMKQLLDRCRERGVNLNGTKFLLKQTSVPYIRHVLTSAGVKSDPAKIEAIIKMEGPTSVEGVRRIMGTINYLAKFLPQLSDVSEPLRQLTKKDVVFVWDQVHDQAFTKLKKLVSMPPLLKFYEPEKELVIQYDASEGGLGAALLQDDRPIAYASRALNSTEHAEIEQGEHEEIMEINQLLASEDVAKMYRDKTDQDEDLQVLKRVIQSGWPVVKNNLPAAVGPTFISVMNWWSKMG